jgi:hypothetical protein
VAVGIDGDGKVGVAQGLGDDGEGDASGDQDAGGGVPEIVQADLG